MDTPQQGNGPGPSPLQMADQAMQQGTSQRDTQIPSQSQQSQQKTVEEILNLEGVSKFKFGEREYTPDQLRKEILMHQDYTKKTQETAKERKYFDNLAYDLRAVADNPALKDEFMKTYPEKFHSYLEVIQDRLEAQQEQQGGQSPDQDLRSQMSKELTQRLDRVENYVKEKEVAAYDAQLDAKFNNLQGKYADADQEIILAQADAIISNGGRLDDKVWEQLFKQSHDKFNQRIEARQKSTLNNQRTANQRAKDMGPGGGTPSESPPKSGGLKGAEAAAIRHYSRS